jgi:hypothetical protein
MTHQIRSGGRYEADKDGNNAKLVEEPTKPAAPEPAGDAVQAPAKPTKKAS